MKCSKCGRFIERVKDSIGFWLPLSTSFPPDNPNVASTVPFAPFVCYNHRIGNHKVGHLEYKQVGWQEVKE